ncbi:MAG: hypothetical protein ACTHMP_11950 [Thermomicrobiales bacterium]|jgi:hypothetical protein
MSAEAIVTVSAAVVALVQVIKWALRRDGWGPAIVLLVSLLGVAVWAVSQGDIARASAWSYFAGWVAVATSAAGVYGFTRAGIQRLARDTAAGAPPE